MIQLCVRQCNRVLLVLLLLTGACQAILPVSEQVKVDRLSVGGVVADEPMAVLAAQRTLQRGGNAVDASVVLYFVLSVTYPVGASIGGGGVCTVYDSFTRSSETIEFLPKYSKSGGSIAVPGAVRGIGALHARYGSMAWRDLLEPAETLARNGTNVSRAFALTLQKYEFKEWQDVSLRRKLMSHSDEVLKEGDAFSQIELGAVISQIARRGAGDLYVGRTARLLSDGIFEKGGKVKLEDLREYRPEWKEAATIQVGDLIFYTIPAPILGGILSGQILAMALDENRFMLLNEVERAALFADVSAMAFSDLTDRAEGNRLSELRAHTLMKNYGKDGWEPIISHRIADGATVTKDDAQNSNFAVIDASGSAVACSLTINTSLINAHFSTHTGILLAQPSLENSGSQYFGPTIVTDEVTGNVRYVAATSGQAPAPPALTQTLLRSLVEGRALADSLRASRFYHKGVPDVFYYEDGVNHAILERLQNQGYITQLAYNPARLNAIYCPRRQAGTPMMCQVHPDPRGYGLGIGGN